MSQITVVSYTPNISSIPRRQYIENGVTNVSGGMPMKSSTSDNSSTFSQGRKEFLKVPTNTFYLQDINKPIQCTTGFIRVDGINNKKTTKYTVEPQIQNGTYNTYQNIEVGQWSRSNHTISNRKRNQLTCSGTASNTCLLNGKKNNIMSSQELISRRKSTTIGNASSAKKTIVNGESNYQLSFNTNNLDNPLANNLEVSNAKRRTRNSGYVVPPKCFLRPLTLPGS